MNVTGLNGVNQNYGTTASKTEKPQKEDGEKVKGQRPPPPPPKNQDTYVPSEAATAALATLEEETTEEQGLATLEEVGTEATDKETSFKVDQDAVNALKADYAQQQQDFVNKMMSMISGQAGTYNNAAGIWDVINGGDYTITPEIQAEAQEAISEDGYWGVEQTANRIVDMAIALSGGDSAKADEMMSYIEKGYAQAEEAWGGELPSITADTKARIDELFAEWKGEA